MLTLIQALNYRCLHCIRQPLGPFHVLAGPNASGKTIFLDSVAFLGHLVSDGLEAAVYERTTNIQDLFWKRSGERFELAVEARIPDELRPKLANPGFEEIRYEISVGYGDESEISILWEKALLKTAASEDEAPAQRELFPFSFAPPQTIGTPSRAKGTKLVVNKSGAGNDNYYSETEKRWNPSFKLGPRKSALGNLPEDETRFPVATWFKNLLADGVQPFALNSLLMRKASPPGQRRKLNPDGSNLPWIVKRLQDKAADNFSAWISHLRTALPDIEDIRIVIREDDRHSYLKICYRNGLEVPSWVVSDGTLRLLALTLPAYLPDITGVYLIEEPENGIHPHAVETVFQSLSSVHNAQVLLATHSPVILSVADPKEVLCFAKTPEGATDIVLGSEHPALKDRPGETDLGTLLSAGALN